MQMQGQLDMPTFQLGDVFNEAQIPTLTYVPPAEAK